MVRAAVVAAVVAALLAVSPALAVLGDNGMTTYDGRPMAPNTLVFGRGMALDKAVDSALTLTRDVLTGTFQPMRNEPATEKQEVRGVVLVAVAADDDAGGTAAAASAGSGLLVVAAAAHTLRPAASPDPSPPCCSLLPPPPMPSHAPPPPVTDCD
jgi:hypothetical protein